MDFDHKVYQISVFYAVLDFIFVNFQNLQKCCLAVATIRGNKPANRQIYIEYITIFQYSSIPGFIYLWWIEGIIKIWIAYILVWYIKAYLQEYISIGLVLLYYLLCN